MITMVGSKRNMTVLSEMMNDSTFQVIEYESLMGIYDVEDAIRGSIINNNGVSAKQIRIVLDDNTVKIQKESLCFFKGKIGIKSSSKNISKITRLLFKNSDFDEDMIKPILTGKGEVFLEPSLKYFTLIELEDEEIVVNDDIFCACEGNIDLSAETIDADGEYEELRLKGSGIVALEIPVPESEILRCRIYKDKLVDFNSMSILRTGKIKSLTEKHDNGSSDNDYDNIVRTYSGTGEVWIIPNKNIYDEISKVNTEEESQDEFYDDDDQ